MISKELEKAFNEQINKELYSAYLYLSMKAYFDQTGLTGFSNWMNVQVQEENAHAMGMFDYVVRRGGQIELKAIEKPDSKWDSPLKVFEQVLSHEEYVTSLINNLTGVAENDKDRASISFLHWYIDEQVEEEENAHAIIDKLKLIKDDANALLLLDKDLQTRVFVQPVIK